MPRVLYPRSSMSLSFFRQCHHFQLIEDTASVSPIRITGRSAASLGKTGSLHGSVGIVDDDVSVAIDDRIDGVTLMIDGVQGYLAGHFMMVIGDKHGQLIPEA